MESVYSEIFRHTRLIYKGINSILFQKNEYISNVYIIKKGVVEIFGSDEKENSMRENMLKPLFKYTKYSIFGYLDIL